MTNAAIYVRVSSDKQTENYSLPTQLEGCRNYAQQHGYTVTHELVDAHTGTTLDRPEFDRLKALAGKVDAVIVYVQDRLGRADELDTWNLIRSFQDKGTQVHTTDTGFIDGSNFLKALEMLLRAKSARDESQKIGERTQRGKKARAKDGKVTVCTVAKYGYDYDRQAGMLVINDLEAYIVRLVYGWYVIGDEEGNKLGGYVIARKLTQMGVPTKHDTSGYRKSKKGYGVWGRSSVMKILRDETYAGTWYYNRTAKGKTRTTRYMKPREQWIPVTVPAIVSCEVWEAAQQQGKRNTQNSKRHIKYDYLMHGRMVCSRCGYQMRCRCDSREQLNPSPYYHCHGQMASHSPDGKTPTCHGSFNRDLIDSVIWNAIAEKLKNPDLILESYQRKKDDNEAELQPDRDYLNRCKVELSKLEDKMQRWLALYLDGKYDKTWLDEQKSLHDRDHRALTEKIDDLQTRIAEGAIEDVDPEAIRKVCEYTREGLDDFTFEDKRWVIELLDIRAILHRSDTSADVRPNKRNARGRFAGKVYSGTGATITVSGYIPTIEIPADFEDIQGCKYVSKIDRLIPFNFKVTIA